MKKITVFISLLFVLCGCSQQEEAGSSLLSKTESADHFYGVKRSGAVVDDGVQLRGIAQRRNLWHTGTTIKVRFLNGTEAYKQKVMTYAAEWEKYADIHFQYVTEGKADVRIGFDWDDNRWITWSYIGTDCKIVTNQSQPTLSFADWGSKPEEEIQGDALRAFGQVLGLELEHRHLSFDPGWTNRIAEYWGIEIEDVPWQDLKEYVFDPLSASDVVMTQEYDEQSIMVWPFHRRYADNTARYANYELSETDKQFIGQLYPKETEDEEGNLLIHFTFISDIVGPTVSHIHVYDGLRNDFVFDWGDGTKDTIFAPGEFIHNYQNAGEYKVKIYGPAEAIPYLGFNASDYTDLVIEKGCLIETLVVRELKNNSFPSIDVTNAVELKSLSFGAAKSIDLSNNKQLGYLGCDNIQNGHLDLSNNRNLELLYMPSNITSLDLSQNTKLRYIDCKSGNLIVADSVALTNMIQTLPLRTDDSPGTLIIRDVDFTWHIPLCAEKNWIVKKDYWD